MNIYQIDQRISELLENSVDPETGELVLDDAELDALQMEREAKVENLACYIKDVAGDVAKMKAEEAQLAKRRQAAERRAERLKAYLSGVLAGEKFASPRVAISWRKTSSVQVNEPVFLSSEANSHLDGLVKFEPKISKSAIKRAIEQGITIEGAEIVSSMSMSIK